MADDAMLEPNDRRVRFDAHRWLMSKLGWRRYGDKLLHAGDPENPIQVMHRGVGIADIYAQELEALAQLAAVLEPLTIDNETQPVFPVPAPRRSARKTT
jgi:hypothetical protein